MRAVISATKSLLLGVSLSAAWLSATETLDPGREGKLDVPGYESPCVLYVPSDYAPGKRLPLILFMHGTGGSPTTWPFKQATKGRGYFVVGLSYAPLSEVERQRGISNNKESCAAMIQFIQRVRKQVGDTYGIDERKVFLTGLSMGGWGVNLYGFKKEAAGLYRGYAILAAGPIKGSDFEVAKGLPVLLLNGVNDHNLETAQRYKPDIEKAGAIVKQVVLSGEGHVPRVESMATVLSEWLAAACAEEESAQKLEEAKRLLVAKKYNEARVLFEVLAAGATSPTAQDARAQLDLLEKDPKAKSAIAAAAVEAECRGLLGSARNFASNNMKEEALKRIDELLKMHPGTLWAEEAEKLKQSLRTK